MIKWGEVKINSKADLDALLDEDYLEVEEGDHPAMADTIGLLVDKLSIVNLKMWFNQEILYEIRRMTPEEFVAKYGDDLKRVHHILKVCCDMNVLRNQWIVEIDDRLARVAKVLGASKEDLAALRLVAPSYKSY